MLKIVTWKILLAVSGFILKKILHKHKLQKRLSTGELINLDISKKIQWQLFFYKSYEPHIERFVKSNLKQGDLVIDIGAHIGYWSIIFSSLVENRGKVIAFEPENDNFQALQENINLNQGGAKIMPVQCALSNVEGREQLNLCSYNEGGNYIGNRSSNNSTKTQEIETIILDKFIQNEHLSQPTLIKIDVEGHELSALEGFKQTLSDTKMRPNYMIIEIAGNMDYRKKMISFLEKFDYEAYSMMKDGVEKVENAPKSVDILFVRNGINVIN